MGEVTRSGDHVDRTEAAGRFTFAEAVQQKGDSQPRLSTALAGGAEFHGNMEPLIYTAAAERASLQQAQAPGSETREQQFSRLTTAALDGITKNQITPEFKELAETYALTGREGLVVMLGYLNSQLQERNSQYRVDADALVRPNGHLNRVEMKIIDTKTGQRTNGFGFDGAPYQAPDGPPPPPRRPGIPI